MTELIPAGLTAADESYHTPGEGDWWGESWYYDFATHDATLGGYVKADVAAFFAREGASWRRRAASRIPS